MGGFGEDDILQPGFEPTKAAWRVIRVKQVAIPKYVLG